MMEKSAANAAVFVVLFSCILPYSLALSSGASDGYTITGRIKIDGAGTNGFGHPAKISNTKIILNGGQIVTFARADGKLIGGSNAYSEIGSNVHSASFNVPAGTHLIEVVALGYFLSPVRVDISARNPGKIQAALTENRRVLHELVLEPLREEQYYEIREPFSIMSIVKSPMGLMLGFMILVVFLMPKLMENMDPEEIKRAQEEMRNQGVPSLTNLLSGKSN